MLAPFNLPVSIAYHVVSALAGALAVPLGPMAAAAAIVAFTIAVRLLVMPLSYYTMRGQHAQARLAPRIQELRRRYAHQPQRLQREVTALYQQEGVGVLSGCLPVLMQAPFLSVMYLLFRSPRIGHTANGLLSHDLFGAALGSHWLGGAGPLSGQGIVFLGVFAVLAVIGWLSSRLARAFPAPTGTGPVPAPSGTGPSGTGPSVGAPPQPVMGLGAVAKLVPYLTVVMAAFVPLAAGLYLVTSTAWTLAERAILRRRL